MIKKKLKEYIKNQLFDRNNFILKLSFKAILKQILKLK